MFDPTTLKDRVVFIAGGTSGINLGIAKGMAAVGAKVAVLGRNPDKATAAAQEITESVTSNNGHSAIALTADVRDPEQVERALQSCVAQLGKIDCLISGAAGNSGAQNPSWASKTKASRKANQEINLSRVSRS